MSDKFKQCVGCGFETEEEIIHFEKFEPRGSSPRELSEGPICPFCYCTGEFKTSFINGVDHINRMFCVLLEQLARKK